MQVLLLLLVAAAAVVGGSNSPSTIAGTILPKPQKLSVGTDVLYISSSFAFESVGFNHDILTQAMKRYAVLMTINPLQNGNLYPSRSRVRETRHLQISGTLSSVFINVLTNNTNLDLHTDESYAMAISLQQSTVTANTIFGALRALETLSQSVSITLNADLSVTLWTNNFNVTDFPRFSHRGYMIDSSRHFLPVNVIMQHIDAMSFSKFNVLHWHIVDDQSFPYVSSLFPNMSMQGAYSLDQVYSVDDMKSVINYALYRGIRVIVEFDTPGHTESWGSGEPWILTQCYNWYQSSYAFNPINNSLYTFLETFFTEVTTVFPDGYLHLGGDEVEFGCWQSNPQIQAWMKDKGWTDYALLEQFYETNLLNLIAKIAKNYVVWQEIFDNGLKVLPATVINVWKGSWQDELSKVTAANLTAIISSPWYLNYISYGEDWDKYYLADPQNFTGTAQQKALVIGGEVCMWGEYVDATNAVSRTWPRASAVGERLWSSETVTDLVDATNRMHDHRCRLLTRSINAEPPTGPSFCPFEWTPNYKPVWAQ